MPVPSLRLVLAAALLAAACAPAPSTGAGDPPAAVPPPAPWSAAPLAASAVPPVYAAQWRAADNRAGCALLAPADLGDGAGAAPRAATFSGGWAVAYDTDAMRSAFGVAGTGVAAGDSATFRDWPHALRWADGSVAGYGPEGGTGPNQLAYLEVAGQRCLYNVWSRLGRDHLEHLLGALRFVR